MTHTELKPCPFCGDMPKVYPAQVIINGIVPESISCINEDCPTMPGTEYLPFDEAIAAWNTRHD